MTRACTTCVFFKFVADQPRCFRPRTARNGFVTEATANGFNALHERDSISEPHRAEGDKCGPTLKHWEIRSE